MGSINSLVSSNCSQCAAFSHSPPLQLQILPLYQFVSQKLETAMMGIQPARYFTRFSAINLSPSRFSPKSIYSSYLYSSRQQWMSYFRCSDLFRHRSRVPRPFYGSIPPSSHSFSSSSSSSSNSNMGFLGWYLGMLERRPVLTKSVSASLIYTAADITSQMITIQPSGSYDLVRTLRMGAFGLIFVGPSQHVWFNYVARVLPKRDVASTLKKICMGQFMYGPCLNGTFFSFNAALQGENHKEIVARLKRDLLPTLANGLMFWPLCDFLTYKVIPVHLQPLINSSFAYMWTIYLTYVASLKKAAVY